MPVLVSFRRFRDFSHARMFLSVVGFNTSFRLRFVVVCLDALLLQIINTSYQKLLLLQILHFPGGMFVRNFAGKTFRMRAIKRGTSVAGKVFR